MIGETQQNLLLLCDRSVGPLVSMYNYYTDRGSPILANKLQEAIVGLQQEVVTMKAGTGQQPSGMSGFGMPVQSPGGGIAASEARMALAERKNANLEAELVQLKRMQAQGGPQVSFGGSTFGGAGIGSYGGASGGVPSNMAQSLPPNFIDDVKDLGVRLVKLESMKDGDAITIGI
jgi:hypothetical protein